MGQKRVLDLVGVIKPIALLKCKKALSELSMGDLMEVYIQDPEVVEDLKKIFSESGDKVIDITHDKNCLRVRIKKGV